MKNCKGTAAAMLVEPGAFSCAMPMKHSLEVRNTSEEDVQSLHCSVTCSWSRPVLRGMILDHWCTYPALIILILILILMAPRILGNCWVSSVLHSQKDHLMTQHSWAGRNRRDKDHHLKEKCQLRRPNAGAWLPRKHITKGSQLSQFWVLFIQRLCLMFFLQMWPSADLSRTGHHWTSLDVNHVTRLFTKALEHCPLLEVINLPRPIHCRGLRRKDSWGPSDPCDLKGLSQMQNEDMKKMKWKWRKQISSIIMYNECTIWMYNEHECQSS